ncbi:protein SOB FIVE-LIKE 4 [Ricinus communis]|uniref:Uncharacterized protein n=1 Tax=Ricinus communis TaxID=3988 RepID=B9RLC6_RICCO|nr:protein SOB FIVE-LIKE 4 [Ricinus communis]EEF47651.1 conserved hypothetical protein [Ricinus communis]|eukprot:XP_002514545.1 uncharacterized protein LOC8264621 [Ricinus communis]
MEASRILGCKEEDSGTSDTESGWTTYIASPSQENRRRHHDDDDHNTCNKADFKMGNCSYDDGGGESDDSMASDASSGPCHHEFPCKSNERNVGTGTTKYSSREKLHRQVKQKDGARPWIKVEKQELVPEAKSAASHIHGGTKPRTK